MRVKGGVVGGQEYRGARHVVRLVQPPEQHRQDRPLATARNRDLLPTLSNLEQPKQKELHREATLSRRAKRRLPP